MTEILFFGFVYEIIGICFMLFIRFVGVQRQINLFWWILGSVLWPIWFAIISVVFVLYALYILLTGVKF